MLQAGKLLDYTVLSPKQACMEESFLYTMICFIASRMLYLLSYGPKKISHVATLAVHDMEPLP